MRRPLDHSEKSMSCLQVPVVAYAQFFSPSPAPPTRTSDILWFLLLPWWPRPQDRSSQANLLAHHHPNASDTHFFVSIYLYSSRAQCRSLSFSRRDANKRSLRAFRSNALVIGGASNSTLFHAHGLPCSDASWFASWALCSTCAMRFRSTFGDRLSRGTGDAADLVGEGDLLGNLGDATRGDLDGLLELGDCSACCCKDMPVLLSLTNTLSIAKIQDSHTRIRQDMNSLHSKSVATALKCRKISPQRIMHSHVSKDGGITWLLLILLQRVLSSEHKKVQQASLKIWKRNRSILFDPWRTKLNISFHHFSKLTLQF